MMAQSQGPSFIRPQCFSADLVPITHGRFTRLCEVYATYILASCGHNTFRPRFLFRDTGSVFEDRMSVDHDRDLIEADY